MTERRTPFEDTRAAVKLPAWLAGGPDVSPTAYRVVLEMFDLAQHGQRFTPEKLAERLFLDEGDVLRAYAELQRKGVLT